MRQDWWNHKLPRHSQPRHQTWVSCIAGRFFTIWATREAPPTNKYQKIDLFDRVLSYSALETSSYNSLNSVQFSSVAQSFPTLCDPVDFSMPGLSVHHQLPEFTQTHVHWVSDAIQPSHPLLSPSPPTFNLSQHQGLFQWVSSSHEVAKVLEFQLQHQSFQWTPRTDLF